MDTKSAPFEWTDLQAFLSTDGGVCASTGKLQIDKTEQRHLERRTHPV